MQKSTKFPIVSACSFIVLISIIMVATLVFGQENLSELEYTHSDDLTYSLNTKGIITIKEHNIILTKLDFIITGDINNISRVYTSEDFIWTWSKSNYTYEYEKWNESSNESINVTYIVNVFTAYNNKANFNWTQVWTFDPLRAAKIKHIITNNLGVSITDSKMWYIHIMTEGDEMIYNNISRKLNRTQVHLEGNFNNITSRFDFPKHTFSFSDLIESGFDITDIYMGNGSIIGYPTKLIIALGVTQGTGLFPDGYTVELDPTVTNWKRPTSVGNPNNDWANGNNVCLSDDQRSQASSIGDLLDAYKYYFNIPNNSTINGIAVEYEGLKNSNGGPCVSVSVTVALSWDGGNTYTSFDGGGPFTSTSDAIKSAGGLKNTWGRSWTSDELNDTNFRAVLKYSASKSCIFGYPEIDYIQLKVNYTLPAPDLNFVAPTPLNNSVINSTLYINTSSGFTLTNCKLEYNASGSYENETMTVSGNSCYITLGGEKGINNGTNFSFRVIGDANGGPEGQSEWRVISAESDKPAIVLNKPVDKMTTNNHSVLLNYTVSDPEKDLMDIFVYGSNRSDYWLENLVGYEKLISNGTFTHNWSAPVVQRDSPDLYALYHLDERSAFAENKTHVFDFSRNNRNGTIGSSTNVTINASGYLGGAYHFDGDEDSYIKIGEGNDFSDVCINGCTFASWVKRDVTTGITIIVGRDDVADYNRFFLFDISVVGGNETPLFVIYEDGTPGPQGGKSCVAYDKDADYINDTNWHHVVGVYNVSEIRIYESGILRDMDDCSDFTINQTAWNDSEDTFIGVGDDGDFDYQFEGLIDEVAIWNRSLSESEILDLYRLANGTYYWNASVQDSPNGINRSETKEFTIGSACSCTSADCSIDCSQDCVFTDAIDLSGTSISGTGSGSVQWQGYVSNGGSFAFDKTCSFGFTGGFELATG